MRSLEYLETFEDCALNQITMRCHELKEKGYRLVQILPKMQEDGNITLIYSFGKSNEMINLEIHDIVKGKTRVPSLTSMFISCFVFENEAHDLYGVEIFGNSLDYGGHFYTFAPGVDAPMTIMSPAQIAAREKKAKIEAAKAARAKREAEAASADPTVTAAAKARQLGDKLSGLDPEKAAKVRAAMEAKAKREAAAAKAAKDKELEGKLAGMDPEKAAKVRAAMEAKAKREAAAKAAADKKEGE